MTDQPKPDVAPRDGPPPRVVIDAVFPEVDGGRYPAKGIAMDPLRVIAHIYSDGHDRIGASVLYGPGDGKPWLEVPMHPVGNDEWTADLTPTTLGAWEYTVTAWIDEFGSWLDDIEKRAAAGWDLAAEFEAGARLIEAYVPRAEQTHRETLLGVAASLRNKRLAAARRLAIARETTLHSTMSGARDREQDTEYCVLPLWVDRQAARFSTWYEMFPRSITDDPARGGTFRSAAARLDDIAAMGFDVLYLPPVHPIGESHRKGRNNTLEARSGDPGSPWAIGSRAGGHTAIHPDLGTLKDFDWFVKQAGQRGLEVALDLAFQCSPDHPWVTDHPEWFRHRPDGSIRYAENPPKQYQDIYPLDFATSDWRALWEELFRVVLFWIERGIRIFRVDNPHTKPFPFWEWLIGEMRPVHPDVLFLAEAFTTPKRMAGLAKAGFAQSYSYFTWRNTKSEIMDYLGELTRPPLVDIMRPNFFVNTPDILPEYLQHGGRPAFLIRATLAATLGPSYGIYSGFELLERDAERPGTEDYLDSEKFQIKPRDWDAPGNIKPHLARLNALRRQYPALQHNHNLWFLPIANDQILAYLKDDPAGGGHLLTVVSLDPRTPQAGSVGLPLEVLGFARNVEFVVRELLRDEPYTWSDEWNHVSLDPHRPTQVFTFEGLAEGYEAAGGVRP